VKLANLLFGRELHHRHAVDGIVSLIMHPGVVDSNFFTHGDEGMNSFGQNRPEIVGPEYPARTIVWLASAQENGAGGGKYFYDMAEEEPAAQGLDDEAARRLWLETEARLATIGY
jgi:NAD(P)-dependent dehydrogenase (short-subunit alcohol dehydrogenase family)